MIEVLEKKSYKSPKYKLLQFFEASRDQWKEKCLKAKSRIRSLKINIRDLKKSRQDWKEKCQGHKKEVDENHSKIKLMEQEIESLKKKPSKSKEIKPHASFDIRPKNHSYSIGQITLFIQLVLDVAIGFRGSSRVMDLTNDFFNLGLSVPAGNTGRLWLIRLGYYKLMRPKVIATDWVWIIDHTVQLGQEKCLFILGIRLCDLPPAGQCLSHKDLEPIELLPVKKSNGEIVYKQLEAAVKKTGVPRAILSDHGSDLNVGIRLFREQHPETSQLYDIKHKTANLLKRELTRDDNWALFTQKANQTKKQVQQTEFAFLEPPKQKTKARYMNIGELIKWGTRIQIFLNDHNHKTEPEYDLEKLEEKFGWVKNFQDSIASWTEMLDIMIITEQLVRSQGVTTDLDRKLSFILPFDYTQERTHRLIEELIQFVAQEASYAKGNERLPGSSEILESCFGKQKQIENKQAKKGFTSLILTLPALVSETSSDIIHKALESVPTKQVIKWYREHFGESVQAKRKKAFAHISAIEST